MTQRPPDEHEREDSRRRRSPRLPLGIARTQQMGNRGLAAASIGWTLAGCILVGFAAGSWLDSRLGTQVWTPVLFLVGVVAGFREMFRTLAQVSASPSSPTAPRPSAMSVPGEAKGTKEGERGQPQVQVLEAQRRQRVFSVPPPPFMEAGQAHEAGAGPGTEEITRRLLGQESPAGTGQEEGGRDAV